MPEPSGAVTFDVAVPQHKVSDIKVFTTQVPRRIMILQDISGSMREPNAQKLSLEAVEGFAESASPTDLLGLVDFNTDAPIDIDPQAPSQFLNALNDLKLTKKLSPKGRTALLDAISTSAAYLQKNPQEGDSIFIVSDGGDNASKMNVAKLKERLLPARIRVYLFALSGALFPDELQKLTELIHLVRDSGGVMMSARSSNLNPYILQITRPGMITPVYDAKALAELRQNAGKLHGLIEKTYRVEFDLDAPVAKETQLNITAASPDGKPAEGTVALCPKYLYPN